MLEKPQLTPDPVVSADISSTEKISAPTEILLTGRQATPTAVIGDFLYVPRLEQICHEVRSIEQELIWYKDVQSKVINSIERSSIELEKEIAEIDKMLSGTLNDNEEEKCKQQRMEMERKVGLDSLLIEMITKESQEACFPYHAEKCLLEGMSLKEALLNYLEHLKGTPYYSLFKKGCESFQIAFMSAISGNDPIDLFLDQIEEKTILFTEYLTDADLSQIVIHNRHHPEKKVVGIVRLKGGIDDHISNDSLRNDIVSVVLDADSEIDLALLKNIKMAAITEKAGEVILNPDSETLRQTQAEIIRENKLNRGLSLADHPPRTKCGEEIKLTYTLSTFTDREDEVSCRSINIGLFRAEKPLITRDSLLTEDELYEEYLELFKSKAPNEVTIRLPDLVADKVGDLLKERLGLAQVDTEIGRALQGSEVLLKNPEDIFRPQIRAILRAAAEIKNARFMFPQVVDHQNLQELIDFVEDEKKDLGLQDFKIRVGAMIENQAAIDDLPRILKKVDFISVGSNDLVADIMGIDRQNSTGGSGIHPMYHFKVIKALSRINRMVTDHNSDDNNNLVTTSVCGRMASTPACMPILIGSGFRSFCLENHFKRINLMVHSINVKEAETLIEEINNYSFKPGEETYKLFIEPFAESLQLRPNIKDEIV